jgi:hypothetical protein
MSARHGSNELTVQTVHRVFPMPEGLRTAVKERHAKGLTLRQFIAESVAGELPRIVAALREALPCFEGDRRPFRAPLSESLLAALRKAAAETGVPATALLFACLGRSARRRRRHNGARAGRVQRRKVRPNTVAVDAPTELTPTDPTCVS